MNTRYRQRGVRFLGIQPDIMLTVAALAIVVALVVPGVLRYTSRDAARAELAAGLAAVAPLRTAIDAASAARPHAALGIADLGTNDWTYDPASHGLADDPVLIDYWRSWPDAPALRDVEVHRDGSLLLSFELTHRGAGAQLQLTRAADGWHCSASGIGDATLLPRDCVLDGRD